MFEKLGRFVVRRPWQVIAAWVIAAAAIISVAPTLSEVTNQDQTEFLPDSYESIQAQNLAEETFGQQADVTATIVVTRSDGQPLSQADQETVGTIADDLQAAQVDHVTDVTTGAEFVSPNDVRSAHQRRPRGQPQRPRAHPGDPRHPRRA